MPHRPEQRTGSDRPSAHTDTAPTDPAMSVRDDVADRAPSAAALRLAALLDGGSGDSIPITTGLGAAVMRADDNAGWPAMGEMMSSRDVQTLVEHIVADATITTAPFAGLTARRLRELLQPGHRPLAPVILAWFDAAGLLAAPVSAAEPFRHPRALRSRDPLSIASWLATTPVPISTASVHERPSDHHLGDAHPPEAT